MEVVLNMIVKDAAQTIERCLESVRPLIDAWVICDTGSTDGTQKLVSELLHDLPGALYEEPWQDFETNRNVALAQAKAFAGPDDYILFMDADDVIVHEGELVLGRVECYQIEERAECYQIEERAGGLRFWRPFLVRARLSWQWRGKTHEALCIDGLPPTDARLEGWHRERGGKTPAQLQAKLERDLALLTEAMLKNSRDDRSQFYLAQTYNDLGEREKALEHYTARSRMGGWQQEQWWAQYMAAILRELLGKPVELVLMNYLSCYERRPTRAEPLWQAARLCRVGKMYHAGLIFAERGLRIPRPNDTFFLDDEIYRWKMLDEYSICAYWCGLYEICIDACRDLLEGRAPLYEHERIAQNKRYAMDRIREQGQIAGLVEAGGCQNKGL